MTGTGKIIRQGDNGRGYMYVRLWDGEKYNQRYVHRLVLESFVGIEDGKQADHIDHDKSNNKLSNLRWVTAKENMAHASQNGRLYCSDYQRQQTIKANRGRSKILNADKVAKIKRMHLEGINQREIGRRMGVCYKIINFIVKGKTWVWVEPAPKTSV